MSGIDSLWLRVYRDVGADRYLSYAELPAEAASASQAIWEVYDRLFGRFAAAGHDPLFNRFTHRSGRRLASPVLPDGLPVVITGLGASLARGCEDLRRVRDRVLVASSLPGALALQLHGLHADLVLIEYTHVFEAQAAADERRHGDAARLHTSTLVLADPATSPVIVNDFRDERCYLADALPTWGLWPATLAALALEADVPAIGLLGLDLGITATSGGSPSASHGHAASARGGGTGSGTPAASTAAAASGTMGADPGQRPLLALLGLLGRTSGVCHDCDQGGAHKPGWPRASLLALAETATAAARSRRAATASILTPRPSTPSSTIAWQHERFVSTLVDDARHDLAAVEPLLPDARAALDMALHARAGNVPAERDLTRAVELMLAWGADPPLRRVLQRGLGLSFLPRFWRTGIRMGQPALLWRPLVLALHELTTQADRLAGIVRDDERTREPDRVATAASSVDLETPQSTAAIQPPPSLPSSPSSSSATGGAEPRSTDASARTIVGRSTRISVLLPVKNGLPYLHDALASLIAQTYADVEILIIDDGSDDGGPEEIQRRAMSHVRVIPSSGQGIAAALNTGLRAATGAFVARQDADDWSHPERLARQFEYLARHPDVDVVATCTDFVDGDGRPIETTWIAAVRRSEDLVQTPEALARLLPRMPCLRHGTVVARRDALRRAGGYRPAFAVAQDYDLTLRLLPDARFAKLPARLYTCRVHDRQASQQFQDQQRRALLRAQLEYVLRRAPRLAGGEARLAIAGDARAAQIYREVGRELTRDRTRDVVVDDAVDAERADSAASSASAGAGVELRFEDTLLPASPEALGGTPGGASGGSGAAAAVGAGAAAAGAAAADWREVLAGVDALVIADVDRIEAWAEALAAAGESGWTIVGPCLVRK